MEFSQDFILLTYLSVCVILMNLSPKKKERAKTNS